MAQREALSGIRIVDFGWWLADPQATRIMADFGAEVIVVETKTPHRYRMTGPYGDQRGASSPGGAAFLFAEGRSPNLSGTWNNHNRNKKSITLNMRDPKGKELAKRLIARSDVVTENFSSRVMENWGLDYENLKKIKADIISISMAGLGHSGPDRDVQTMGPIVQALSGLSYMSGFPDMPPAGWGYSYMDHTGGYFGAMAILMALHNRNVTGKGQWIDLAQVEAGASLVGAQILEYSVNGTAPQRNGNRLDHPATAPHGIYRCQGEDRWCAIAVFSEEEWQGLCRVMGDPPWTRDPKFATHLARVAHQDELDQHIQAWTINYSSHEVMYRLQGVGVPSGAVQSGVDRLERDPQLKERRLFVELEHPEIGKALFEGMPVKLSETPASFKAAAPRLGEHNAYVFGELLGLSEKEMAELAQEGVV